MVWKYRCTHRPEVVNISRFLTGTTRIKLSIDELPSPVMRSTFPRATALNRRSHRSFCGSVSASQPEWRVSFPSPYLWKTIFMFPRTMPAGWLLIPGEKLCTRLAFSPAQSSWLLIPQDLSGFSMSSKSLSISAACGAGTLQPRPCPQLDTVFCLVLSIEVTAAQIGFSRETPNILWWCPKPHFFHFFLFLTVQSSFC